MPTIQRSKTANVPPNQVWDFVKEMNNWAPFLQGYQSHEMVDESTSIWTLKGKLAMFSRVTKLQVQITEWAEGEKVAFSLKGMNEPLSGGGIFTLEPPATEDTGDGDSTTLHVEFTIDMGGSMGTVMKPILEPWVGGVVDELLDKIIGAVDDPKTAVG